MNPSFSIEQARRKDAPVAITGGRIAGTEAGAAWIEGGKIRLLCDEARARSLARRRRAEVIDLRGGLAIPGIVDCHLHVISLGLTRLRPDLSGCRDPEEAARIVAAFAEGTVERSGDSTGTAWITGRGWRADLFPGGKFPDARTLDRFVPHLPVALWAFDGHACWVNSAAMRIAGISRETPDPPGGRIGRDGSGNPTGIFFESACDLIWKHVPRPGPEEERKAFREGVNILAGAGFTGCHDAQDLRTVRIAAEEDEREPLPIRFRGMFRPGEGAAACEWLKRNRGRERVGIVACKVFLDGSFASRTAWLLRPGPDGSAGIRRMSAAEVDGAFDEAAAVGVPVAVHAIGDAAVREALDAVERVGRRLPASSGIRCRIEHAQLVHRADIPRFAKLGVAASIQPQHIMTDWKLADELYAFPDSPAYPYRSLAVAGAVLCIGSDAPVLPGDRPGDALYAAAERRDGAGMPEGGWTPEERLSVEETLDAFSRGAAIVEGASGSRGKIAEGFDADLTLLREDIRTWRGADLRQWPVLGTIVAGCIAVFHP
ncbi:MAG: amidohydrolase [Planctomycetota bacterium]|nr:amidohydrolase [Planctomycetota bacterium]